ncbi:TPA: sulfate adenylyltransferase, partial [Candidatus Micrarchaeota archaeon]|nr:sulfate adenylyltransferase [Candidatus Micrarchaeota archaeon]
MKPHGGRLVERLTEDNILEKARTEAGELGKLEIDANLLKEVENISCGAFSPLEGFMDRNEAISVLEHMRLPNDVPWTIPILLPVSAESRFSEGDRITLTHDGAPIAVMDIAER